MSSAICQKCGSTAPFSDAHFSSRTWIGKGRRNRNSLRFRASCPSAASLRWIPAVAFRQVTPLPQFLYLYGGNIILIDLPHRDAVRLFLW